MHNILLVEDDEILRGMLKQLLERANYSVFDVDDGKEVQKYLNQGELPDLIITDMIMPGLNGRELAEKFTDYYPEGKVLFVSGYLNEYFGEKNELDPSINFLAKPFKVNQLNDKIREILKK